MNFAISESVPKPRPFIDVVSSLVEKFEGFIESEEDREAVEKILKQVGGDEESHVVKESEGDAGAFFDGEQVREEERLLFLFLSFCFFFVFSNNVFLGRRKWSLSKNKNKRFKSKNMLIWLIVVIMNNPQHGHSKCWQWFYPSFISFIFPLLLIHSPPNYN